MVFPDFRNGVLGSWRAPDGFVAEARVQVSERVTGFSEKRGKKAERQAYGQGSPWSQRGVNRFFETSGVCFCGPAASLPVVGKLVEAFCDLFGVQQSDIGVGMFRSKSSPSGADACAGVCVYDATYGRLRLTQSLADGLRKVVERAQEAADANGDAVGCAALERLLEWTAALAPDGARTTSAPAPEAPGAWVEVIAAGDRAM
jgi:hypothetical protein